MSLRPVWLCLAIVGCASSGDGVDISDVALDMTEADAARVLDLVHYPTVDLAILDKVVGLDVRAARAIDARTS
jgi:hypothetical protein